MSGLKCENYANRKKRIHAKTAHNTQMSHKIRNSNIQRHIVSRSSIEMIFIFFFSMISSFFHNLSIARSIGAFNKIETRKKCDHIVLTQNASNTCKHTHIILCVLISFNLVFFSASSPLFEFITFLLINSL